MKRLIFLMCCCSFIVGCGNDTVEEPPLVVSFNDQDQTPDLDASDMKADQGADMGVDQGVDMAPKPKPTIEQALADLPGVVSVSEGRQQGDTRIFTIDIVQQIDQFDDNSRTFIQQVFLFHRSETAPVVLVTSGYGLGRTRDYLRLRTEVGQLLNGNEIFLGHRFFQGAVPEAAVQDWSKVNIKQGAADNHKIVQIFKNIYKAPWVGTGWSKGGMTALFHERFYPEDLDLVIPMVTPISLGPSDARYPPFLANIGTESCRDALDTSIIDTLDRTEELVDSFDVPASERPQYRSSLKYTLLAYHWSYWQYLGHQYCPYIPDGKTASPETLVNFYYYYQVSNDPAFAITEDDAVNYTYGYQAATQLGYPSHYAEGYLDTMVQLGYLTRRDATSLNISYRDRYRYMPPWAEMPAFDPAPMKDIDTWLKTEATDVLAIYGEYDPWTAGKVTLNEANRSKVYVAPTGSHGTFLKDLTPTDYKEVEARILMLKPASLSLTQPGQTLFTDRQALRELLIQKKL